MPKLEKTLKLKNCCFGVYPWVGQIWKNTQGVLCQRCYSETKNVGHLSMRNIYTWPKKWPPREAQWSSRTLIERPSWCDRVRFAWRAVGRFRWNCCTTANQRSSFTSLPAGWWWPKRFCCERSLSRWWTWSRRRIFASERGVFTIRTILKTATVRK